MPTQTEILEHTAETSQSAFYSPEAPEMAVQPEGERLLELQKHLARGLRAVGRVALAGTTAFVIGMGFPIGHELATIHNAHQEQAATQSEQTYLDAGNRAADAQRKLTTDIELAGLGFYAAVRSNRIRRFRGAHQRVAKWEKKRGKNR